VNSEPAILIDALLSIIDQWLAMEPFADGRDVPSLNSMWRQVARGPCGSDAARMAPFSAELGRMRFTADAGGAPKHALRGRLLELIDAGMHDLFLIVAVRQGMDRLILARSPEAYPAWKELADAQVPIHLQFGFRLDEASPSPHRYGFSAETEEGE
jgi:hypothetical protein